MLKYNIIMSNAHMLFVIGWCVPAYLRRIEEKASRFSAGRMSTILLQYNLWVEWNKHSGTSTQC